MQVFQRLILKLPISQTPSGFTGSVPTRPRQHGHASAFLILTICATACNVCNSCLILRFVHMKGRLEKFTGGPTQSTHDRIYVSINAANVIGLNNNCYKMLGRPPAVYLYFSREDDLIAIEPVHSHRLPAAFPVKQKATDGWRINASPFCKNYNIRIDTTERFTSPEICDGKLHLKLSETTTIRQMRRKRAK